MTEITEVVLYLQEVKFFLNFEVFERIIYIRFKTIFFSQKYYQAILY